MPSPTDAHVLLEAQRSMLSGDDHVRREIEPWRYATPAERLVAFEALSRDTVRWLSRRSPGALERAPAPAPLPDDALPILRVPRRGSR